MTAVAQSYFAAAPRSHAAESMSAERTESLDTLVILMVETEQPEGLSARKLVVETAKHNVLTAYTVAHGLELLRRFPNVDILLIHALVTGCGDLLAAVRSSHPGLPIIVATPDPTQEVPGANYVIDSHEPAALVRLLAERMNVSTRN